MPLPMSFDDSLDIADPEIMKQLHKSEQIIREVKPIIAFATAVILLNVGIIAFLSLKVNHSFGCSTAMMLLSSTSIAVQYAVAHYAYKRNRPKLKLANIILTVFSGFSIFAYIMVYFYSCTIYNTYVLFYYYIIIIIEISLQILATCCQRRLCVEVINQLGPNISNVHVQNK